MHYFCYQQFFTSPQASPSENVIKYDFHRSSAFFLLALQDRGDLYLSDIRYILLERLVFILFVIVAFVLNFDGRHQKSTHRRELRRRGLDLWKQLLVCFILLVEELHVQLIFFAERWFHQS
jgi:hypothetical protein